MTHYLIVLDIKAKLTGNFNGYLAKLFYISNWFLEKQ